VQEYSTRAKVDRAGHAGPMKGFVMSGSTDKAAGMANEAAGKIKQGVGKAVGSEKLHGEGAGQEAKGDAQQLKGVEERDKKWHQQSGRRGKQKALIAGGARVGCVNSRPSPHWLAGRKRPENEVESKT
jgi:uncharacterized protein YjbJ (UPF0337 family)